MNSGIINTENIQNNAITNAKIEDNTITANEISNNAITNTKIAPNTITAIQILDGAITNAKIEQNTITATQLSDGAITNAKIAQNTITANEILNDAIINAKIAQNTITTNEILDGAITNDKIITISGEKIVGDISWTCISGAVNENSSNAILSYEIIESSDTSGSIGNIRFDMSYLYIHVGDACGNWMRASLSEIISPGTIQEVVQFNRLSVGWSESQLLSDVFTDPSPAFNYPTDTAAVYGYGHITLADLSLSADGTTLTGWPIQSDTTNQEGRLTDGLTIMKWEGPVSAVTFTLETTYFQDKDDAYGAFYYMLSDDGQTWYNNEYGLPIGYGPGLPPDHVRGTTLTINTTSTTRYFAVGSGSGNAYLVNMSVVTSP